MRSSFPTIALLDSGVGGLNILKALQATLPAHYLYFADTANMPYGTKEKPVLEALGTQAIEFLCARHPDLIIIACHTLSAVFSLATLETNYAIPFIGMIDLVSQLAYASTKNNNIGIIATPATIKSNAHFNAISNYGKIEWYAQECPELASFIERNPNDPHIPSLLTMYLKALLETEMDTLILGCTHYEAIESTIKTKVGPQIKIIGASSVIAKAVEEKLCLETTYTLPFSSFSLEFFVSGDQRLFYESAKKITNFIKLNFIESIYNV